MHLVTFIKILPLTLPVIFEKNLMNNNGIFDLILLKFLFQKSLRKKLPSKVLF
jgi:hypothetical protein